MTVNSMVCVLIMNQVVTWLKSVKLIELDVAALCLFIYQIQGAYICI